MAFTNGFKEKFNSISTGKKIIMKEIILNCKRPCRWHFATNFINSDKDEIWSASLNKSFKEAIPSCSIFFVLNDFVHNKANFP
jgi:hypothetical protein